MVALNIITASLLALATVASAIPLQSRHIGCKVTPTVARLSDVWYPRTLSFIHTAKLHKRQPRPAFYLDEVTCHSEQRQFLARI